MPVMVMVRDRHTGLVQLRRPAELAPGLAARLRMHAGLPRRGQARDPAGLDDVDGEALLEVAHRRLAQVFAAGAPLGRLARSEVEDHALAQRTACRPELVDAEVGRERVEDREAPADDGAALVLQAGEREAVHAAGLEAALHQPAQARRRDAAIADVVGGENARHGADRAGGAERFLPVARRERFERLFQLGTGRDLRFAERPLAEASLGKILHRQAHAADLERLGLAGSRTAADDHFGRPATDVDDQPRHGRRLQPGDTGEDQARFLATGDDLDGMAEHGLGAQQERVAVLRLAQRLRRHRPHLRRREAVEPAREAAQAGEAPFGSLLAQVAGLVEPGAEAHRLLQVVDAAIAAAVDLADLETKAVRADVDRGQLSRPAQFAAGTRRVDRGHAPIVGARRAGRRRTKPLRVSGRRARGSSCGAGRPASRCRGRATPVRCGRASP